MKIRRVYGSFLPKLLKARAFVLYPFIIFKDTKEELIKDKKQLRSTYRHEWEHILDIENTGWFKWYFNYLFRPSKRREYEARGYAAGNKVYWSWKNEENIPLRCIDAFYADFGNTVIGDN